MKSKLCLTAIALSSLLLFSCQKEYSLQNGYLENGPAPVDFTGTWNIVQLASQGSNSTTTSLAGETLKMTVEYVYYTKGTSGRMLVDDKTFVAQDLSYTIDTTMTMSYYSNGSLLTSMEMPFYVENAPPTTPMPYRKVSADSIVLTGQLTSAPSGTPVQSEEIGFKLLMFGDTLVMRGNTNFTVRQPVNGVPGNYEVNLTNLIKLVRP